MADEIDDEAFDEEDLAEGFDAEDLEADDVEVDDLVDEAGDDETDEVLGEVDDAVDDDADADEVAEGAVVAEDEDDLHLDEDVELALDEVLAETMRLTTEPDDDDDAVAEPEEKSELSDTVLPKQDDEFRCHSCRLLKKMSQLADENRQLCRDCV